MKSAAAFLLLAGLPFLSLQAQVAPKAKGTAPTRAVAVLHPASSSQVRGVVLFVQKDGFVEITGEIVGLTPGPHGFHIHEFGDCSAPDATSAGEHFNPTGMPHGAPEDPRRHVGDLGNIVADAYGKATLRMTDKMIQLHGPNSIVGRSVILHANPDDFKSQPAGNAGPRLACGVIGYANPKTLPVLQTDNSRPGGVVIRKKLFPR